MKKFKFSLEKILELKKFNEEECKMALGHAISLLNEIEIKIKETAVKHHQATQERVKDPSELSMWSNYIIRLDQEKEKLLEQAAKAAVVVEEKRDLYMEAFQELTAIKKLKEKKETQYKKETERKESEEIDEIFAVRQNKRKGNIVYEENK
ncbi:MAG: flagellar export protein FliJ [Treponema sp.]|nr:flagellar export protein FliJ [Treponema sp.]MCL2251007.1 flagellar export protein FliJ [Treponema sp.]